VGKALYKIFISYNISLPPATWQHSNKCNSSQMYIMVRVS